MSKLDPILPGATLGMLGGGQLGRMFTLAARQMGYRVSVLTPEGDSPTGQIAHQEHCAPYDDVDAVSRFAEQVAVVTFEFENVPAETVAAAEKHAPVRPGGELLHTTQNRLREKRALAAAGVPTVRFAAIESEDDLAAAVDDIGTPSILKTAAWGYDGKGQARIEQPEDAERAWSDIGRSTAVLEAVAPFEREISVVGARGLDGSIALYQPFDNDHHRHILDVTLSPADIPERTAVQAHDFTRTLLEAWDVVGVLCVEMFLLPNGELLVNEIAPRPHNSGHVTIDSHVCSQFEQQVRAVCGLPLGSPTQHTPAAMVNLLGDLWQDGEPDWASVCATEAVALHLYGKAEARPGRKMGHLTAVGPTLTEARDRALAARRALTARSSTVS